MLDSEGIAGKRFLKFESVVKLLKEEKEKGNLFAEFPIGATMQDGGKRKRSNGHVPLHHQRKIKNKGDEKSKKEILNQEK